MAANHLLANGFVNIGLIAGPGQWYAAEMRKKAGKRRCTRPAERSIRQLAEGDWTPQSGEQAFFDLMRRYPEMDAVFAANDQMAYRRHAQPATSTCAFPKILPLSVLTMSPRQPSRPRLTTVRQPVVGLGRLSVKASSG